MTNRDRPQYQYDYAEECLCPYDNKFCSLTNIRGACAACEKSKPGDL